MIERGNLINPSLARTPVRLLAMAVLAMSAATAHAASSVTLYGVIDTSVGYASHSAANGSGLYSFGNGAIAPSRWGLRIQEDLGNGLAAVANLEQGFNIADGSNAQAGRQFGRTAIVGLQGRFGKVTLGRDYSVLYEATAANDVYRMATTPMVGFPTSNYTALTRLDNGIKYQNHFGPVSVGIEHRFAGSTALPQGTSNGMRLAFDRGPLHVGGAYQTLNDKTSFFGVTVPTTNQKVWMLGGTYKFAHDELFAYYTHSQLSGYFDQLVAVGVAHHFTPSWNWQSAFDYDHLSRPTTSGNRMNISSRLTYLLSKRSSVYIQADYSKFTDAWQTLAGNASFTNSLYGASSRVELIAGMLHRF